MGIFRSTPDKTIQRDNRDRLSTKLAECDQAIARHATAAKESALSGDDSDLDAAEASLRAAQDRAATLKTALTEINQRLADLERAKEDAADKKLRRHTACAVTLVFEALGLDRFMTTCRRRCQPLVAKLLRAHGCCDRRHGACRPAARR
jgi:thioesterase domain-containing protein